MWGFSGENEIVLMTPPSEALCSNGYFVIYESADSDLQRYTVQVYCHNVHVIGAMLSWSQANFIVTAHNESII